MGSNETTIQFLERVFHEFVHGGGKYQYSILEYLNSESMVPFSKDLKMVLHPDTPASRKSDILFKCIQRAKKPPSVTIFENLYIRK